jgi:hypothetical protein
MTMEEMFSFRISSDELNELEELSQKFLRSRGAIIRLLISIAYSLLENPEFVEKIKSRQGVHDVG